MRRWWFSIHKWVGLAIGLQILAWMVSGLFMTFVPIEQVRSEHNIRKTEPLDLRAQGNVVAPAAVAAVLPGRITRLELGEMLGTAVWRADIDGKPAALIDARSGTVLSPLDESNARRIAEADFAGKGTIESATLIEKDPPIEYRGALPVWQFVFDDEADTHLYVSPATGKVAARRSGVWRVYDFLWSLHIMDYQTRDNFNNWLVILASAIGLVLTVTGFGILVYRFWPKSMSN
jgi:uncharacterized iron-regulated membrane protein